MTAKEQEGLDYVLKEIQCMRSALVEHIKEENDLLEKVKGLFEAHGTTEMIRTRVEFVNFLMDEAADRVKLRKVVIEKLTVGGVWALLLFVVISVQHEIVAYFRK